MFEQGLVQLVNANSAVQAICAAGGYATELPKSPTYPNWTHTTISRVVNYTFDGPNRLQMRRVQIDCFGTNAADCINLATALENVLSGYVGTLPDGTYVQGCFLDTSNDFFDDTSRSYRRATDYLFWYAQ